MTKRIGILTAGSDCPGLNAAIRAIGKAAQGSYGMEIVGFQDGFSGLIHDQVVQPALSGILTAGGTILGTSRETLPDTGDTLDAAIATYRRQNLDMLACVGGHETMESAWHLAQHGLNVVALPKGIDNDQAMTDVTIGFDTALNTAAEAI